MQAPTGMMSGAEYGQLTTGNPGADVAIQGASIIFGQVFANRNIEDLRIGYDDVVAEDIHRDNRSLMIAAITALLAIAVVWVLVKK